MAYPWHAGPWLVLLALAACASPPHPRLAERPIEPVVIPSSSPQPRPVVEPAAPESRAPREVRGPEVRLAVGENVILRAPYTRSFSSQPADAPCVVRPGPDAQSFLVSGRRVGAMALLFVFADGSTEKYDFVVGP